MTHWPSRPAKWFVTFVDCAHEAGPFYTDQHPFPDAALRGEVVYEHRWADEPAGDAAAVTIPKFAGSRASITENPARWMVRFDCGHVGGPFYTDQHPFPPAVLHCGECRALRTAVETFTPDFKD